MAARRARVPRLLTVLAVSLVPLASGPAARAATPAIVVNSVVDPGDGTCDGTECTLREAIAKANADAGADEIDFAIPGAGIKSIVLHSALPAITDQLLIDGYTQGGPGNTDHLVNLVGNAAGSDVDGLTVSAAFSTIRGLSIGDFLGNGIVVTADDVTIAGDQIGIQPDGSLHGNGKTGVVVDEASNVVVGGPAGSDRNVISDNNDHGVAITSSLSHDNTVEGNFIGTDLAGTAGAGNDGDGVFVSAATGTTIGGDPGNLISDNGQGGVFADGIHGIALTGSSVTDTLIQGNFIGTDLTGTLALGNAGNGVFTDFTGAHDTTITGNVLSGNDEGIVLFSASGTSVQTNLIGTTGDGMSALPNRVGVGVEGPGVTIGGVNGGNVISGNLGRGIDLQSDHAVIQGNLVGTAADGTHALGNGTEGMNVSGDGLVIGGTVPGAGNVVAASGTDGIRLAGGTGAKVRGNAIGTDASGTRSLGNAANGIDVVFSSRVTIGGTTAAARNLVKHNGGAGVLVSSTDRNRIRRNVFGANGGLGIDLGGDGVTPNDAGDADAGANQLQNFPVVRSAVHHRTTTTIDIRLHSTSDTTYAIDVFASGACDPSGHGEAARFLKSLSVTTDASGAFAAFRSVPVVPVGNVITATATDPLGNTSEFSACRTVTAP